VLVRSIGVGYEVTDEPRDEHGRRTESGSDGSGSKRSAGQADASGGRAPGGSAGSASDAYTRKSPSRAEGSRDVAARALTRSISDGLGRCGRDPDIKMDEFKQAIETVEHVRESKVGK
jgi:hypothetical protein